MTKNTRELKELLLQFIAYGHEPITVTFSGELGDDTKVFQMPFNTMLKAIEKWNDDLITQTKQELLKEVEKCVGEMERHSNGKKLVNPWSCDDCGTPEEPFTRNELRTQIIKSIKELGEKP